MPGNTEKDVFRLPDIELPWKRSKYLAIPGKDESFRIKYRVELTASGGVDDDCQVVVGVDDKNNPRSIVMIDGWELIPDDTFSFENVDVLSRISTGNDITTFNPPQKVWPRAAFLDAAISADFILPEHFMMASSQRWVLFFQNTSILGPAGYDGEVWGRILRKD
jgi:hypothetical protein